MAPRIALVTGANTGVGFEVARALARRGMVVYLGSRDEGRGRTAVEALAGEGDIRPILLDTTREETLKAAVETIGGAHGQLDVLVNNAGVAMAGNVLDVTPETVRESFETNVHGPARLTQLAVPLLRRGKGARVVMVSSSAGSFAWMAAVDPRLDASQLPYAYIVSKTALNAATVLFASALKGDGIKVNACNPGYVKSQVSRFMGTRTPEEGSRIIVHLATLDDDGPTGGFFDEKGTIAW